MDGLKRWRNTASCCCGLPAKMQTLLPKRRDKRGSLRQRLPSTTWVCRAASPGDAIASTASPLRELVSASRSHNTRLCHSVLVWALPCSSLPV